MLSFIAGLTLFASVASAEPPSTPVDAPQTLYIAPEREETSESDLRAFARKMALKYGVSYQEMAVTIGGPGKTVACAHGESSWDTDAVGDGGDSRGIAQIHRPSHPDITDEQALDPYWSIEWMAQEFSKGNQWMWTCWKDNYASKNL